MFYADPLTRAVVAVLPGVVRTAMSAADEYDLGPVPSDSLHAYIRAGEMKQILTEFALDALADPPNLELRVVLDDRLAILRRPTKSRPSQPSHSTSSNPPTPTTAAPAETSSRNSEPAAAALIPSSAPQGTRPGQVKSAWPIGRRHAHSCEHLSCAEVEEATDPLPGRHEGRPVHPAAVLALNGYAAHAYD